MARDLDTIGAVRAHGIDEWLGHTDEATLAGRIAALAPADRAALAAAVRREIESIVEGTIVRLRKR